MFRICVLPDVHARIGIKESALTAVESFMTDWHPTHLVYSGDFMNMDSVSPWAERQNGTKTIHTGSLLKEYDYANKIIDRHQKICGKKCEYFYLEGNHEVWIRRYMAQMSEMEGLIEVPRNLRLEERGFKWISEHDSLKIGRIRFIHGHYVNDHHAKKHGLVYTDDERLVYCHTHDVQTYSFVSRTGKMRVAQSIGTLATLNPHYLRGKPNKWVQAFAAIYMDGPVYNVYVPYINKGRFMWNGKEYKG